MHNYLYSYLSIVRCYLKMEVLILGNKLLERLSSVTSNAEQVTPEVTLLNFTVVNAFLVGDPLSDGKEFVLVDTGLENAYDFILETVKKYYGKDIRPQCIVLTHGHFDHVGSVIKLSEYWDVPVYIHELELPYVTGKMDYPKGDSTVGGEISQMSPSFPHTSIDISYRINILPQDGKIPGMYGWKWIHTPGHTRGHISLFKELDRVLIAGDAISTTKQESMWSVITKKEEISGPPAYMTEDWEKAKESIIYLKSLEPAILLPSHGKPLRNLEIREQLEMLVNKIDKMY